MMGRLTLTNGVAFFALAGGLLLTPLSIAHAENPRAAVGEAIIKAFKREGDEITSPHRPYVAPPAPPKPLRARDRSRMAKTAGGLGSRKPGRRSRCG